MSDRKRAISDPVAIGKAADIFSLGKDIEEFVRQHTVDEMVVIMRYRAPDGSMQWRFDHTRLDSKFALVGVMQWVGYELLGGEEK